MIQRWNSVYVYYSLKKQPSFVEFLKFNFIWNRLYLDSTMPFFRRFVFNMQHKKVVSRGLTVIVFIAASTWTAMMRGCAWRTGYHTTSTFCQKLENLNPSSNWWPSTAEIPSRKASMDWTQRWGSPLGKFSESKQSLTLFLHLIKRQCCRLRPGMR